jgi:hypothetical protein
LPDVHDPGRIVGGTRKLAGAKYSTTVLLCAYEPPRFAQERPDCGSARCWPLNHVFIEGLLRTLEADPTPAGPFARLEVISSDHGHVAGAPGRLPDVTAQVERAMAELLNS